MYIHPFFAPDISFEDTFKQPWLTRVPPFKIIDNLYFVGTKTVASHLLVTQAGLVLLDTPFVCQFPLLLESIAELGFRPSDIRHIVMTHEHCDHIGCAHYLKALYGCKLYLSEKGAWNVLHRPDICGIDGFSFGDGYVEPFETDVRLHDGQMLDFGDVRFRCVATPGHTDGVMSYFFDMQNEGKTYTVGMFGGTGFNTLTREAMAKDDRAEHARADYFQSLDKVEHEKVDIMLGNHPNQSALFAKRARYLSDPAIANPFVDSSDWQRYICTLRTLLTEFVAQDL